MSTEFKQRAMTLDLPRAESVILTYLGWRYNSNTGRCYPSHDEIMKDTRYSRRTVCRAIASLQSRKLIRVEFTGRRNFYHFLNAFFSANQTTDQSTDLNAEYADQVCQDGTADVPNWHSHIYTYKGGKPPIQADEGSKKEMKTKNKLKTADLLAKKIEDFESKPIRSGADLARKFIAYEVERKTNKRPKQITLEPAQLAQAKRVWAVIESEGLDPDLTWELLRTRWSRFIKLAYNGWKDAPMTPTWGLVVKKRDLLPGFVEWNT